MGFFERDGVRLHYDDQGRGPAGRLPVVLLMGLGFDATAWGEPMRALAGERRVLALDLRGTGGSARSPRLDYRLGTMAADVVALLEHLGLARAHVAGLSFGGLVAQRLATSAAERVGALALLATAARADWALVRTGLASVKRTAQALPSGATEPARVLARAWLPLLCPGEATEQNEARLQRLMADSTVGVRRADAFLAQLRVLVRGDLRDELPRVRAPTLVLAGAEDRLVPLERMRELAEAIPGARLQVLPGAGHGMTLCRGPEVGRRLCEFFREHDGPQE